jgi:hypothetical protein
VACCSSASVTSGVSDRSIVSCTAHCGRGGPAGLSCHASSPRESRISSRFSERRPDAFGFGGRFDEISETWTTSRRKGDEGRSESTWSKSRS